MPNTPEVRQLKARVAAMREEAEDAGVNGHDLIERFFKEANRRVGRSSKESVEHFLAAFPSLLRHCKSDKPRRGRKR